MKKLFAIILTVLTVALCSFGASAADGMVVYDGNSKDFIFQPGSTDSPTDLFPDFKDVMPGDTLTQPVTVRNDADKNVKVKIYMRALGAQDDAMSQAFLSELSLKVTQLTDTVLFDAAADETAQLTDWVCLGLLYSGGEAELEVLLRVPNTLGNEFQDNKGLLDWEFKVEEFPVEPTDPKPPQTGDDFAVLPFVIVFILAAAVIIVLLFTKRSKKDEENIPQNEEEQTN